MRKTIIFSSLLSLLLTGCKEDKGVIFSDGARVQLTSNVSDYSFSFVWSDKSVTEETVYIPVRVIGGPADYDRQVSLEQVAEYNVDYKYDDMGNVVDSVVTERTDKAVEGRHYVAFNTTEAMPLQMVRAGRVTDSIGVRVKRDASLADGNVRLRLRIVPNSDFMLGESKYLERTIVIADRLEKPSNWNYTTNYYLGDYSQVKHELMVDVVKGKVDEEWVNTANNSSSFVVYWRGLFIEALENFNSDPANIASGKAPLRENPNDPNSRLISFPTKI